VSVPRIIVLSFPPMRHNDSGNRTESDRFPVAGRFFVREAEGKGFFGRLELQLQQRQRELEQP